VVVISLVFLAVTFFSEQPASVHSTTLWLLLGGVAVAAVGFVDDLGHVNQTVRFVVHLLAVALMLAILPALPGITIGVYFLEPGWFLAGFYVIALVWFINLFNFMDGIDGIAGVQSLSMLAGAVLISFMREDLAWVPMFACLAACVAGFLVWNWPPAKVFMGDACSGYLGFVLGALAIGTSIDGPMNLWSWAILGGVFLIDATVTLLVRMLRGKRWYQAHRSHAYQILSRRLQSHSKVTIGVLAINVFWLMPWALAAAMSPERGFAYCLIAWAPILVVVIRAGAGREELESSF
jgi:Fuc2NAc and GlcNAc transferase